MINKSDCWCCMIVNIFFALTLSIFFYFFLESHVPNRMSLQLYFSFIIFSTKFISYPREQREREREKTVCVILMSVQKKTQTSRGWIEWKIKWTILMKRITKEKWRANQFCVNFSLLCYSWAFASLFFSLKI